MYYETCSSYNDISTKASFRDHVGWVWYDREFYLPGILTITVLSLEFGANYLNLKFTTRWGEGGWGQKISKIVCKRN